jgi:tryptophan-rich sensory protein
MSFKSNKISLLIWIITIIAIGSVIGSLTKPEISTWYSTLHRSNLTPPNYVPNSLDYFIRHYWRLRLAHLA